MNFVPAKTPLIAKKLFPNYVWNVPTTNKELYLTFDDGPTPEITHWTLEVLKQYNAKATFFCIGSNIKKHPKIFKSILQEGHAIGNHTQHHVKGWKTPVDAYLEEVEKAQFQINAIQQTQKRFFRPPYGQIRPEQGKALMALGYEIIMWDVLSFDWDERVTEVNCLKKVTSNSKPGSIIVFHDSVKASRNMMYTLPKVLEHFSSKGFVFKSLDF